MLGWWRETVGAPVVLQAPVELGFVDLTIVDLLQDSLIVNLW